MIYIDFKAPIDYSAYDGNRKNGINQKPHYSFGSTNLHIDSICKKNIILVFYHYQPIRFGLSIDNKNS